MNNEITSEKQNRLLRNVLFTFFVSGAASQPLGSFIPFLREQFGFSYDLSGVLLSCQSTGNLISVLLAGFLPIYLGRRRAILATSVWMAAAYLIFASGFGSPALFVAAFTMTGIARGGNSNFSNTMISTLPGDKATRGYNLLHGCFAVGALLSPLALVFCTNRWPNIGWRLVAGLLALLCLSQIAVYAKMPLPQEPEGKSVKTVDHSFLRVKQFWLGSAMLFFYISVEYAIVGWLVSYFQDTGVLSADWSQMMNSLLWLVIFCGRMIGAAITGKISRSRLLLIDGAGFFAFFLVMFFSRNPVLIHRLRRRDKCIKIGNQEMNAMELLQTQSQQLNHQQIQGLRLLQMGSLELEQYLRELAQENPMVDLEPESSAREEDDGLLSYLRWLEDNDHQNLYYSQMSEEELDPLSRIGTEGGLEETLFRFLSRQLYTMDLDEDLADAVRYLASSLDDRGYLTAQLSELAQDSRFSLSLLERALEILRELEPAGVGAENLSQCLELQLLRIRENGPALTIVRSYLDLLAKRHYPSIASKMNLSVDQVKQAGDIIRELDPRPGAIFERADQIPYILPDIFVGEEDGRYTARARKPGRPPFRINAYYRRLLSQSQDPQVKDYLKEKLQQAEGVLRAVDQRESTLLRCAQAIVDGQAGFFRLGPQALLPMRLADVAETLGLHESTVSRAVREKYIQCTQGVYPMSYFFSRSAAAGKPGVGGAAARLLLKQLIDQEDKPLSDQKLAGLLAQAGCPVSRRTVAKYRGEMNIPDQAGRARSL